MQERRTTVRIPCLLNAQYRLAPDDGASPGASPSAPVRVTDLSQQGAGLLSANRLSSGQRLTVRFALPHESQEIAVRGRVRWIGGPSGWSRQWAAGLAFDRLDETTQFCVNGFVADRAYQIGAQDAWPAFWLQRLRLRLSLTPIRQLYGLSILVLMAGLLLAVVVTQRSAAQLRQMLADRGRAIEQLEAHHQLLLINLHDSQRDVEALDRQLSELKQYSSEMEARAAIMADQLEQTRQEYVRLVDDREQLRQELTAMQARQATLETRLQSLPDLRQAMADVVRLQQRQARQIREERLRQRDQQELASGNRGYVVRQPPPGGPAVSITVYPPEAVPPAASGAAADATEALVYDP